MIVLLIGETPTSGVHKKALFKSFNIVAEYTCQRNRVRRAAIALALPFGPAVAERLRMPYEFRVVGPRFSGSERSLSFVISEWISQKAANHRLVGEEKWNFRVVTGCAMKIDAKRFTEIATGGSKLATVEFGATVVPFDSVMSALFDFLWRRNGRRPLGKVALLTESDTEFGKSIDQTTIESWLGSGFFQSHEPATARELQLIKSLRDASEIPASKPDLLVVAAADGVLHFRAFDGTGKMAVDTNENELRRQDRRIEELKKKLSPLWPPHVLTAIERTGIIQDVMSILGKAQATQVTQIKFPFHVSQVALAYDEEGSKLGRTRACPGTSEQPFDHSF